MRVEGVSNMQRIEDFIREALKNEMNSRTGSVEECCAANLDGAVEAEGSPGSSPDLGCNIGGTMADAEADVLKASLKEVATRPANRVAEGEISAAEAVSRLTALKKAVEEEEEAISLLTALKKAIEEKKDSNSSPALNFIPSCRMTASEADILKKALKKAVIKPSARPAKNASDMNVTRKEAVNMKKVVRRPNIDLSRELQELQEFRDLLNSGDEHGWYRDQGREVRDNGQEVHHEVNRKTKIVTKSETNQ